MPQDTMQECCSGFLLETEAVDDRTAGINDQGYPQRQVGLWLEIRDLFDRPIVVENRKIAFRQIVDEVSPAVGNREYQIHLLYFLADCEHRRTEWSRVAGQLRGTGNNRETEDK